MKKILLILPLTLSLNAKADLESFLNYTFGETDVNKGEELFTKIHKCSACHGSKGDKSSGTFKALTSLSAQELKSSLKSYKIDKDFGGRSRFAMQRYANRLSDQDIDDIISFIKGKTNLDLPNSKNAEPSKKTEDNQYLE